MQSKHRNGNKATMKTLLGGSKRVAKMLAHFPIDDNLKMSTHDMYKSDCYPARASGEERLRIIEAISNAYKNQERLD